MANYGHVHTDIYFTAAGLTVLWRPMEMYERLSFLSLAITVPVLLYFRPLLHQNADRTHRSNFVSFMDRRRRFAFGILGRDGQGLGPSHWRLQVGAGRTRGERSVFFGFFCPQVRQNKTDHSPVDGPL